MPRLDKSIPLQESSQSSNQKVSILSVEDQPTSKAGYGISSIRVLEYRSSEMAVGLAVQAKFTVKVEFHVTIDLTAIILKPIVEALLNDATERELVFLKTEFLFRTINLEQYRNGDKLALPRDFMGMLINLAVGTTRGILFSKNLGSPFANLILPPLDIAEMIPNDPIDLSNQIEVLIQMPA